MEHRYREVLIKQRPFLVDNLCLEELLDHLVSDGILNERTLHTLQNKKTRFTRAEELLDLLPRRGPDAFHYFMKALLETGQQYIYDHLKSKMQF